MALELYGRKKLTFSGAINNLDDAKRAIQQNYIAHTINVFEINYLWEYYLGKQDVRNRTKEVRKDILKNTVVNHANQIVSFFSSYAFGEGTQYVKRGRNVYDMKNDTTSDIAKINAGLAFKDKQANDIELAKHFLTTGVGYRSIFPADVIEEEELPIDIGVLDPRQTAVIYSTDIIPKPLLAFSYVEEIDSKGAKVYIYYIYTDKYYWQVKSSVKDNTLSWVTTLDSRTLNLGYIPIIEYNANPERQGVFEIVIPILNMINEVTSNRGEGIEQFIQAYWKFVNTDITESELLQFLKSGAIVLKSGRDDRFPSDVDLIKQELDQNGVQAFIDDLTQKMYEITGVPDRRNATSGSTGAANKTSNGWYDTDNKTNALEGMFIKSEKQFLRVLLSITKRLSKRAEDFKSTNLADIDIKFSRNKTDNILVKTQALIQLLEAGINPRIAISVVGLFNDPEAVYEESKETLAAKANKINTNPNPSAETINTEEE